MLVNKQPYQRITARVSQEIRITLSQAADITGATINQFLVQAALEKAQDIIEQERIINLSALDAELFFKLIDTPPKVNNKLLSAMKRYKESDLYVESDDAGDAS